MITISLCMIVKNEEAVLGRCLGSVQDAIDEIIVVDTGSTDRTKEIARQFTSHIYDFNWIDDFSIARNASFDYATMDYQMWLDADDILLAKDLQKLIELKQTLPSDVDMVTMKYNTHFDQNGVPTLTSHRERLMKRANGYRWQEPVHECIPLSGNIYHADITVTHQKGNKKDTSDRNIRIYEALERQCHMFNPRQLYYFARELQDHHIYEKSTFYYEKFLEGGKGWIEDNIATCFNLANCYAAQGKESKVLPTLLRSFQYDSPRAEACCGIGYYYERKQDWQRAADWFYLAGCLKEPQGLGFILRDYWGFIPCIELCVCWHRLGDNEKAAYFNELAAEYKPHSPVVEKNRVYFASLNPNSQSE